MRYLVDELEALGSRGRIESSIQELSEFRSVESGSCSLPLVPKTRAHRCSEATPESMWLIVLWRSNVRLLLDGGPARAGWAVDALPTLKGGSASESPRRRPSGIRWTDPFTTPTYRRRRTLAGFRRRLDRTSSRCSRRSANASVEARWKRSERARCAVVGRAVSDSHRRRAAGNRTRKWRRLAARRMGAQGSRLRGGRFDLPGATKDA